MAGVTPDRMSTSGGLAVTSRTLLMVLFTGVETAALGLWLALVRDAPLGSRAAALGLGVLTVGLVVEHILTDVTVNGPSLSLPLPEIVGISLSEAGLWAVWLLVAERVGGLTGVAVAGVGLFLLLIPQHTVEDNVLRGNRPFATVLDGGTVGFSLVEATGASAWLALVFFPERFGPALAAVGLEGLDPAVAGLALLALFLLVEHDIGLAIARRE